MKTVPLRYLAELNPAVPEFESMRDDDLVGFLPLETVWADSRADQTRNARKGDVKSGYTRFAPGDVVVPKVTPTFQAARSMIAERVGAGTTELHVLRPRPGVDPRWVCYATRSAHFLTEGVTAFQGVAGLQRVPGEFVNGFRVAAQSADEQRRIADFLDDRVARIDRIIAARREQSAAIGQFRERTIADALGQAAAHRVPVRRLLSERPAYGVLPDEVSDDPSWPRYVRTTDIGIDGKLKSGAVVNVAPDHLTEYQLRRGDVLVARSGNTIGKCMVVPTDEPAVFAGYLIRLRFTDLDPRAYWYFSQTRDFSDQLWANAVQSTIPNFNAERYSDMTIPDLRGQTSLFDHLDKAQQVFSRMEFDLDRSIALLAEYRASLITAAVTGELDVTTAGSSGIPA